MESAEQSLRQARLRVTRPRVAVLVAVQDNPHADVETITAAVRCRLDRVSVQAIYDILRVLTEAGLVRRIEPAGSPSRYEARVGDNHHHVVCRRCGAVADVECVVGARPCLKAVDDHGYLIDEAEVTYWGLCPACRSARSDLEPAQPARAPQPPPSAPSAGEPVPVHPEERA
ncbi:MAG TPA: Fur family transcriptional regulator [Dermatophilaceae bacterium]|nr:Fur family transcriptional regulator [Dermatophilaceae bacterium]